MLEQYSKFKGRVLQFAEISIPLALSARHLPAVSEPVLCGQGPLGPGGGHGAKSGSGPAESTAGGCPAGLAEPRGLRGGKKRGAPGGVGAPRGGRGGRGGGGPAALACSSSPLRAAAGVGGGSRLLL